MISIDPDRCSGCRRCEVYCSFFHSGKVGRKGAKIKVVKIEEKGIDFPVVCIQCQERYCVHCPEAAITIGSLGQVIISEELCNGCGICETLCPIGAIEIFEDIPHVCNLCGGKPHCVTACTMDAITYDSSQSETIGLKEYKKGNK